MPSSNGQLCFVQHGSQDLERLEAILTSRQRRCNMMMVKSAEQAEAILRRECAEGAPDLAVIWGGSTDERAAKLVKALQGDSILNKAAMIILADEGSREEAEKSAGAAVVPFRLAEVERLVADESFWWVVVRFAS